MEILQALFAPFVMLVITTGITFAAASYWFNRKAKQDAENNDKAATEDRRRHRAEADAAALQRIAELEKQLATISSSVQPLHAAYQAMLVKQLTHFHTPVLDALLAKLEPFTLTKDEEAQMHDELLLRSVEISSSDVPPEERITDEERDAAIMLPYVIKRVRKETAEEKELKIVSVSKDPEEVK